MFFFQKPSLARANTFFSIVPMAVYEHTVLWLFTFNCLSMRQRYSMIITKVVFIIGSSFSVVKRSYFILHAQFTYNCMFLYFCLFFIIFLARFQPFPCTHCHAKNVLSACEFGLIFNSDLFVSVHA